MAVTSGHGNPAWTRDETLLALELYLQCEGKIPSGKDPRVAELSRVLRSLPLHSGATKRPTFRNPDGVSFKLLNLHSVRTGGGLSNTSKTDKEVWADFGDKPDVVKRLAHQIRETAAGEVVEIAVEDDQSFSEGRVATYLHTRRERKPALRVKLLENRAKLGPLKCDACGQPAVVEEEDLTDAIFEAHHLVPLHLGEVKTKVSDLALLCASCHRLLHRAMIVKRRWIDLVGMKELLGK